MHEEFANNELALQLASGQNLTAELIAFFQQKLQAQEQKLSELRIKGDILQILFQKDNVDYTKKIICLLNENICLNILQS